MFWRKRSADDFAEEIKSHLELEADELKREGLSEDEARRTARREFGNVRRRRKGLYEKAGGCGWTSCGAMGSVSAGCGRVRGLQLRRY